MYIFGFSISLHIISSSLETAAGLDVHCALSWPHLEATLLYLLAAGLLQFLDLPCTTRYSTVVTYLQVIGHLLEGLLLYLLHLDL